MRALALALSLIALSGCSIIYKLPTRQGNVIEQKDLDKLKVGMTREQVKFVMGTPIASTPFRSDRWDYVGYYKSPRGDVTTRSVTLYFDKDTLARMEGISAEKGDINLSRPDANAIIKQERLDREEDRRAQQPQPSQVPVPPEQQP
jgi:outer membrane protein assembly factor BamE (lipoprotein component of BamABCDE complex)